LEALTETNVRVVFEGIKEIVPQGIKLDSGEIVELDAIVCATGFDVSWKPRFPVIGRGGADLREQWGQRPTAYMSLAVPNFPNYFGQSLPRWRIVDTN
jgi:cation diffusion facilitator CzcD-associated flavoprotein CzcO